MKHILQNSGDTVWANRDLRLLGPAQALTFLAGEVVVVTLLLQAFATDQGSAGTAAVLAVAALPLALGTVLAGPLVDRVSSRRLGVAAACWQAVACAGMVAVVLVEADVRLLLLGLLLMQMGQSVAGPTMAALLPGVVPLQDIARATGSVQALVMLVGLGGPVVAGTLMGLHGAVAPLLLAGGLYAGVAGLAAAIRTTRGGRSGGDGAQPRALDGMRFLRDEPVLRALVSGFVAFVLAVEVIGVVAVFLVLDSLSGTELQFGLVESVLAAGLVAGNLVASRLGSGGRVLRGAVVGTAGMSVAMVAAGAAPTMLVLGAAFLFLGAFNGLVNTTAQTTLALRVPPAQRGRVFAAVSGVLRTASVVGLVAGGAAGAWLGPRELFVVAGLGGLAVSVWLWRALWTAGAVSTVSVDPTSSSGPAATAERDVVEPA